MTMETILLIIVCMKLEDNMHFLCIDNANGLFQRTNSQLFFFLGHAFEAPALYPYYIIGLRHFALRQFY